MSKPQQENSYVAEAKGTKERSQPCKAWKKQSAKIFSEHLQAWQYVLISTCHPDKENRRHRGKCGRAVENHANAQNRWQACKAKGSNRWQQLQGPANIHSYKALQIVFYQNKDTPDWTLQRLIICADIIKE